eukprot:14790349-Alexandrium_andersonii.AAC.1
MSASLVGSEMCIRDSCWHRQCGAGAAEELEEPLDCSPPRGSAGLPLPVSYTHLTLPTICSV